MFVVLLKDTGQPALHFSSEIGYYYSIRVTLLLLLILINYYANLRVIKSWPFFLEIFGSLDKAYMHFFIKSQICLFNDYLLINSVHKLCKKICPVIFHATCHVETIKLLLWCSTEFF